MLVFQEGKSLKDFCTFRIGGPARLFVEVKTLEELKEALFYCFSHSLSYFLLGKGSNCLFDDRGFDGVVILNKVDFLEKNENTYFAGGGCSFAHLGIKTAREALGGLEFAAGIPGSVGGAVFMNAGAHGKETCDVLKSVHYIHENGKEEIFERKDLSFSYRHSPFQEMRGAIGAATFVLSALEGSRKQQIELLNKRKETQPVNAFCAGCAFRNPSQSKLSAGKLIEDCGLKGTLEGDAQVSELHANYIINRGKATAEQVKKLMEKVVFQVKEKTGIELEKEVRFVPYSYNR